MPGADVLGAGVRRVGPRAGPGLAVQQTHHQHRHRIRGGIQPGGEVDQHGDQERSLGAAEERAPGAHLAHLAREETPLHPGTLRIQVGQGGAMRPKCVRKQTAKAKFLTFTLCTKAKSTNFFLDKLWIDIR